MVISHVSLIVKKEYLELKKNKAFLLYYLYIIIGGGIVLPIFTPFNSGTFGVSPFLLMFITFIGIIIPSTLVSDLFAGEKERKTLETLISTPIKVFDLFVGKVTFVMVVSISIMFIVYCIDLLSFNVVSLIDTKQLIYPFTNEGNIVFLLSGISLSFFVSVFGSIMSLRTKNVKSCNLIVVLVSSPVLAPILLILNKQPFDIMNLYYYSSLLIIISITIILYIRFAINKLWVMGKIK